MMKNEEEDEKVCMTEEELKNWLREQVEKNKHVVQRRAQLAEVEDWVKRKERDATYTRMLYNNTCESVLECESMIKGLYGMLGLEYRDTDSEEDGGPQPAGNVFDLTVDFDNGEDERGAGGDAVSVRTWAPETAVKEENKEIELSAGTDISNPPVQTFALKVEKTEAVNHPVEVKPASPPTTVKNTPSGSHIPTIKTFGCPVPITAPSSCDLPVPSFKMENESSPVTSPPVNETAKTPPLTTIPNTSSTPTKDKDTDGPETPSDCTKQNVATPEKLVAPTPTPTPTSPPPVKPVTSSKPSKTVSVNQKPGPKSRSLKRATTSDAAGKTPAKEKQASPKPSSTTTPSSSVAKAAPAEKAKGPDPKQVETKSSSSKPYSGTTASDKASKITTSTRPPDAKEAYQSSSASTAMPAHVQKEVELKVNMSILGRRRTKTWHKGTILDIKSTESGPRYKILFDGGKGKSVLSAHHLACVGSPMLKDLFVGCRVVALYKEEAQSWLHAAVVVEMPDRKNRMRFLVFFDDGRPAYIALPDLHLVCKALTNMTEDIEDEVWRAEVEEYLQAYPNPVFVVMRIGEDCKVERSGEMEVASITQVDGSLIEVCYKSDEEKEWLYKGSNRLEQIRRIKKRMEKQKKEQAVNKAGWITPQNTKPSTTTNTSTTVTTTSSATPISTTTTTAAGNTTATTAATTTAAAVATATSAAATTSAATSTTTAAPSTTVTTNIKPFKTSPTPSVSQIVSLGKRSPSPVITFAGEVLSQPRVVLTRITVPDVKTESAETGSSDTRMKRPSSEDEESKTRIALVPFVEPRLKYVPHRCCPACLNHHRPTQRDQNRGQNPLLIPLLHGFRRMTARRRLDGKMSFHVFYRAPCGRSLCEMEEVQAFLFESRCDFLFLEMFCLDPFVLVKRASLPSSMADCPCVYVPDISGGKEVVPVPCVNELNDISPPRLTYITHRLPAPGVFISTNLDFMVGCDCTDGCRDRSKCACHQMTIEATSLFTGGPVDVTAGYTHKRLPRYVPTGVYECNPLCRCDPRLCGNRLVQHGLQLRLEVFMTQHKGWGLRCLDDVSKGTFVCVFTGKVVTDEVLMAENLLSGNEYLANLDYIEGVEKLKEGYESEAYCSDQEEESDKNKTRVTMMTGALKKHAVFTIDSSSSSDEEKEETSQQELKTTAKRKRKPCGSDWEDDDDNDDDDDDEDFMISPNDSMKEEQKHTSNDCNKIYATRRNARVPEKKDFPNNAQTSHQISEEHTEVTASMAKKMRKEGPGEHKLGFAKKSTRPFAIKSSHNRVKAQAEPEKKCVQEKKAVHGRRCTRSLFDGEKSCYLIDAKQEGNLARYINHSCSPNLFVQNVFVDTHDLRFPWVAFFTSKRIRAGTELTWDYSYEVGSVEGKVLLCCCGSASCTGRLL